MDLLLQTRWSLRDGLENWIKSLEMDLLIQTHGVAQVTFAPNYDAPNPFGLLIGCLASNDPLAQKLSTQLTQSPETYSALLPAIRSA
jgi:hypothetical protein